MKLKQLFFFALIIVLQSSCNNRAKKTIHVNIDLSSPENRLCIKLHNTSKSKLYLYMYRPLFLRLTAIGTDKNQNQTDLTYDFITFGMGQTAGEVFSNSHGFCDTSELEFKSYLSQNIKEAFHKQVTYNQSSRNIMDSFKRQSFDYYLRVTIDRILLLKPDSTYVETFFFLPDSMKFKTLKITYDGVLKYHFIDRDNIRFDTIKLSFPEEVIGYKRYDGEFTTDTVILEKK